MKINRIIIIGEADFIGLAVARHIIQNTADVVGVVNKLTYTGNLENLMCVADDSCFTFEKVDICDEVKLDRFLKLSSPLPEANWRLLSLITFICRQTKYRSLQAGGARLNLDTGAYESMQDAANFIVRSSPVRGCRLPVFRRSLIKMAV